ncbi:MAG: transporter substrate-binding domain-containing protein [Lachnospiraceae bacterium]|nr:transporter substrate-binding domain-containing protein [Lachnospiraceae bacterium]
MTGSKKKVLLICLFIFGVLLLCTGCARRQKADESLDKILESKRFVMGFDAKFPPWGYINEETGEAEGFDIDLAREVCRRMGVELVPQPINWRTKEEELSHSKVDCIWNGMSVDDKRVERMTLTAPYMKNDLVFVVRNDSDIRSMEQMKGLKVGVQGGATSQTELERLEIFGSIIEFVEDDNITIMSKIATGELDAALTDSVFAYYYVSNQKENNFLILPQKIKEEDLAIGFRRGDYALRDRVQQILDEMRADGTMARYSTKWFGTDITIK